MKINIYAQGLCAISVCVPKDATKKQIEQAVNAESPTGIASSWKITRKKFKTGEPSGVACNTLPNTHRHWLLIC